MPDGLQTATNHSLNSGRFNISDVNSTSCIFNNSSNQQAACYNINHQYPAAASTGLGFCIEPGGAAHLLIRPGLIHGAAAMANDPHEYSLHNSNINGNSAAVITQSQVRQREEAMVMLQQSSGFKRPRMEPPQSLTNNINNDNVISNSESNNSNVNSSSNKANCSGRSKEKLGERISALQQLVSPFGKTDTASVLSEAIGYIKFLQEQVQVLSSPYMKPCSSQQLALGKRQDAAQLINQASNTASSNLDLRSRGLCLVPVSCTLHVANNNIGADFWASSASSSVNQMHNRHSEFTSNQN